MNIPFIIRVLENRLQTLNNIKTAAIQAGDLQKVVQIEGELAETELTLTELRTLGNT